MHLNHPVCLRRVLLCLSSMVLLAPSSWAETTAFTYQGFLEAGGASANGVYDFRFSVWESESGGTQIGSEVDADGVSVSDGLFSAVLDFGSAVFTGVDLWLQVNVQTNGGGGFTSLVPRARITASPYAVLAARVPPGSIGSSEVAYNSLRASDLAEGSVGSSEVADNSLTASDLAFHSVGRSELAPDAVSSAEIADNAVTSSEIAPNAVHSSEIATDAVRSSEIAVAAVGTSEVENGSLTGDDLADGAVGSVQLADAIDLGSDGVDGSLDIFSANNGESSVRLLGGDQFGGRLWLYSNDRQNGIWMAGGSQDAGIIQVYNNQGQQRLTLDGYGTNQGGEVGVFESDGSLAVQLASDTGGRIAVKEDDASDAVLLQAGAGGQVVVNNSAGTAAAVLSGTASSGGYQYLYTAGGSIGVQLDGDSDGAGFIGVRNNAGLNRVALDGYSSGGGGSATVYAGDGSRSVFLEGDSAGAGLLTVRDNQGLIRVRLDGESTDTGGEISVYDDNGTETVEILGAEGTGQGGQIVLKDADGNETIYLDGDFGGDGRVTTEELQITGGSDLSEQFDVAASAGPVRPGMVVCIDPRDPGRLTVSSRPYDRTVAGVVSGAGNVRTGMLMGQAGSVADGAHPVALSGRVYCLVDAGGGAVEPGDLITSSGVPGHGMKVTDHTRAPGAVIGKAMTPLEAGRGLVLILVSLQ